MNFRLYMQLGIALAGLLMSQLGFTSSCNDGQHIICGPQGTCEHYNGDVKGCMTAVEWYPDGKNWQKCTYGSIIYRFEKCYIDTGHNNSCEPDAITSPLRWENNTGSQSIDPDPGTVTPAHGCNTHNNALLARETAIINGLIGR